MQGRMRLCLGAPCAQIRSLRGQVSHCHLLFHVQPFPAGQSLTHMSLKRCAHPRQPAEAHSLQAAPATIPRTTIFLSDSCLAHLTSGEALSQTLGPVLGPGVVCTTVAFTEPSAAGTREKMLPDRPHIQASFLPAAHASWSWAQRNKQSVVGLERPHWRHLLGLPGSGTHGACSAG